MECWEKWQRPSSPSSCCSGGTGVESRGREAELGNRPTTLVLRSISAFTLSKASVERSSGGAHWETGQRAPHARGRGLLLRGARCPLQKGGGLVDRHPPGLLARHQRPVHGADQSNAN